MKGDDAISNYRKAKERAAAILNRQINENNSWIAALEQELAETRKHKAL